MGTIDISKYLKSAATSAASAFGSAVGAQGADFVLNLVGIETDELAPVKRALADIQQTLKRVEAKLGTIENKIDWLLTMKSFSELKALVDTQFDNAAGLIAAQNNSTTRDAEMTAFLNGLNAEKIETAIAALYNDVTGKSSLFGNGENAAKRMYRTEWGTLFANMPLQDATDRAMEICYRVIDLQWRGALLAYNVRMIKGEPTIAQKGIWAAQVRLHEQNKLFVTEAPSLMAYIMSGFPYAAAEGGGWHVRVKSSVTAADSRYLSPDPILWNGNTLISSNMAKTATDVLLVTSQKEPMRFELRGAQQYRGMEIVSQKMPVTAGSRSVYRKFGPREESLPVSVWRGSTNLASNPDVQVNFLTTAKREDYLVRLGNQNLVAYHVQTPKKAPLESSTGVTNTPYNITYATRLPLPAGEAATWEVKLKDSNEVIYKQMFP
ncbi:hypothetical protein ASD8599_02831 [Ascidiaceihabitans donghaensis]|uniref:Uncharacterized protein n=1 Tax=Ascidiaceihabitans donghaensis TaxID=1510460 RepID=A0A2R8BG53_9RHOB|nr:hypothetical protein [Ascidiaceihabitans donghaensis]SPH22085.1 hypothetical protein ASD8599_02831 [Ascidiaceihabitans donghaensis]